MSAFFRRVRDFFFGGDSQQRLEGEPNLQERERRTNYDFRNTKNHTIYDPERHKQETPTTFRHLNYESKRWSTQDTSCFEESHSINNKDDGISTNPAEDEVAEDEPLRLQGSVLSSDPHVSTLEESQNIIVQTSAPHVPTLQESQNYSAQTSAPLVSIPTPPPANATNSSYFLSVLSLPNQVELNGKTYQTVEGVSTFLVMARNEHLPSFPMQQIQDVAGSPVSQRVNPPLVTSSSLSLNEDNVMDQRNSSFDSRELCGFLTPISTVPQSQSNEASPSDEEVTVSQCSTMNCVHHMLGSLKDMTLGEMYETVNGTSIQTSPLIQGKGSKIHSKKLLNVDRYTRLVFRDKTIPLGSEAQLRNPVSSSDLTSTSNSRVAPVGDMLSVSGASHALDISPKRSVTPRLNVNPIKRKANSKSSKNHPPSRLSKTAVKEDTHVFCLCDAIPSPGSPVTTVSSPSSSTTHRSSTTLKSSPVASGRQGEFVEAGLSDHQMARIKTEKEEKPKSCLFLIPSGKGNVSKFQAGDHSYSKMYIQGNETQPQPLITPSASVTPKTNPLAGRTKGEFVEADMSGQKMAGEICVKTEMGEDKKSSLLVLPSFHHEKRSEYEITAVDHTSHKKTELFQGNGAPQQNMSDSSRSSTPNPSVIANGRQEEFVETGLNGHQMARNIRVKPEKSENPKPCLFVFPSGKRKVFENTEENHSSPKQKKYDHVEEIPARVLRSSGSPVRSMRQRNITVSYKD